MTRPSSELSDPALHLGLTEVAAMCTRLRRDPALRGHLAAIVAPASGLHPASVDRLLWHWADGFVADAFLARATQLREEGARGRGPVVIVAPSNLPVAAWTASLEALLLGLSVRLRPGSGDPGGPRALQQLLAEAAPSLGGRLRLVEAKRDDSAAWRAITADASAIVAFGGDPALDAITALAPAGLPVRRHGPKVSLGLLRGGPGSHAEAVVTGLLEDALLADGRGCLSLRALLVEGSQADAEAWAEALAQAATAIRQRWPAGALDPALLAQARLAAEADAVDAAIAGGVVVRAAGHAFSAIATPLERGLRLAQLGPGAGLLRLFALPPGTDLAELLHPLRHQLAALVTPEVASWQAEPTASPLFYARCPPGRMQAPRWHLHDGVEAGTALFGR